MAEVLITLGIIGIVAAMTLPALIGNYQKKQAATQLKKVYTILQQATQRAEVDFESVEYWNFELAPTDFFNLYIKPYYKVIQDYSNTTFPADYTIFCNSADAGTDCMGYGAFRTAPKMVIVDGTILTFNGFSVDGKRAGVTIIADINGFKKPNRYGRDVFMFSIQIKGGVLPYGVGKLNRDGSEKSFERNFLMDGDDNRACKKDGLYCAAVIMMDDWEIKSDYPWH